MSESSVVGNRVIAASGGETPAVAVAPAGHPLLALERGRTVYAMARSGNGELLACAGRTGQLQVLEVREGEPQVVFEHIHGVPILGICALHGGWAYSDQEGGVFWGKLEGDMRPVAGNMGDAALTLVAAGDVLVAHTASGRVRIWTPPYDRRPPREMVAPAPPKPYALANGRFSTEAATVFFTSAAGQLVAVDMKEGGLHSVAAHEGPFFALLEHPEGLLTFGKDEGVAKLWAYGPLRQQCELAAPLGVVAAGWSGEEERPLVLVMESGGLQCATIQDDAIVPVGEPVPGAVRSLQALSWRDHEKVVQEERERSIEEALRRFEASLDLEDYAACADWAGRLQTLGCDAVAVLCRAELASKQGCAVEEVRLRKELTERLPLDSKSLRARQTYAELLVRHGVLEAAAEVFARMERITGQPESAGSVDTIHSVLDARQRHLVICEGMELDAALQAMEVAAAVGERWHWAFPLVRSRPFASEGIPVDADRLLQIGEGLIEHGKERSPGTLAYERLLLFEGLDRMHTAEAVTISRGWNEHIRLVIALVVKGEHLDLVQPFWVVVPQETCLALEPEDWLVCYRETLQSVRQEDRIKHWEEYALRFARVALERLIAQRRREERWGGGE